MYPRECYNPCLGGRYISHRGHDKYYKIWLSESYLDAFQILVAGKCFLFVLFNGYLEFKRLVREFYQSFVRIILSILSGW